MVRVVPTDPGADRLRRVLRPEDQVWETDGLLVVRATGVTSPKDCRRLGQRMVDALNEVSDAAVAVVAGDRSASVDTLIRQGRQALAVGGTNATPAVVFLGRSSPRDPGGALRTAFVGREQELHRLNGALSSALGGQPGVGVVEGDPGIGKTALLHRWSSGLASTPVLWASGDEAEVTTPWGVLRQLAAGATGRLAEDLGELTANLDPDAEPLLIGGRLLSLIGEYGDAVIVIDDAHLADPQSLAALRHAGRRMTVEPLLMLLAHPSDPQGVLGDGWRRLVDSETGVTIRLEGLSPCELVALASLVGDGRLSPAGARRLWEETAGHPLFARDLLARWPANRFDQEEDPLPPPSAGARWARERLSACGDEARQLVEAVAIIGRRARPTSAAIIAEVADPSSALTEAVAHGLLQEAPEGSYAEVGFPHPILRNAVYHHMAPDRRRELHLRAASQTIGWPALEHRWAASAGPDEQLADDLEMWGRAEAARVAPPRAIQAFQRALLLSPPGPARTRRLLLAVEAMLVAGDANAAAAYDEELDSLPGEPWVDYVAGYLSLVRGRSEDAVLRLQRSWSRLEAGDRPVGGAPADLAARVASQLAIVAVVSLDSEAMVRFGAAAVNAGAGEGWVGAFARFAHTIGQALAGRAEEALTGISPRGARADGTGLDALVASGMVRLWTDDLEGARRDLRQAVERAGRGEPLRVSQALAFLGEAEYRSGHLASAIVHTEDAVTQAEAGGRYWDLPMLLGQAALPRIAAGDWAEAEAHVSRARDWAELVATPVALAYSSAAAAALAERHGQVADQLAAARIYDSAYACPEPGAHSEGPLLARALIRAGQLGEAATVLERFEARATTTGRRSSLMAASSARGQLEAARGDWERASAAFESALAYGDGLPLPLEVARVRLAYGRAALSAGRLIGARRYLLTALATFERNGAGGLAEEVISLMEGQGLAPPRRRDPRTGVLTPAEGAVVRLAVEGLTNAEIARRLFVSTKTVEYHLSRVFAKLGVHSRHQLAALLEMGAAQAD